MKNEIRKGLGFLLAGLLVLSPGCGTSTKPAATITEAAATSGGMINISLHQDPPKLDPTFSTAFVDRHVFQSLFDKLIDLNEKGKMIPMLAEKWDVSQDGKTYTFHLRHDVKFQDGTDFNAEAVKFNFDRNMDKASIRRNELGEVNKVTVVDPYTINVELKKAFAPFLTVLTDRAGMMVSPEAVKKYGVDFASHPVGTGPFMFQDRVKGSTITLAKNPNYWQKSLPKLDKVVYKIIPDANVALMNLKSGQVDLTNRFPFNEISSVQKEGKLQIVNEPGPGFRGMFLNVSKPPFNNKDLGKALDILVDRDAIVQVVLNGAGTAGHSPFPPNNFANGTSDSYVKPDIAQAKDILRKAGIPDGFSFTLKIDTDPVNQQVAQMLQNMFKPAGVTMNIEKVEFGALLEQAKNANFEAATISWSGRSDPDQNIYDWFVTGGTQNYSKYSNQQTDKLLNDARATLDDAKRKELYDQVMDIVHQDNSYIYFYHEQNVFGLSKSIKGFKYIPDGMIRTAELSISK